MAGNRRDFIKATAAMSVVGASDALAQQTQQAPSGGRALADIPWIGFLHSTALEFDLEQAFLTGLRQQNWEGNPTEPAGNRSQVIIRRVHGNGRYRANDFTDLKKGADDLRTNTSANLKLLVAAGGLVSGLAAVQSTGVPMLVVLGRPSPSLAPPKVGGYFFDYPTGATQNQNLIKKIGYLNTTYSVPLDKMCLLYNGNSNMGAAELTDWKAANPSGVFSDASKNQTLQNKQISFPVAFKDADDKLGGSGVRAIVVSGDPFFTMKRARIIRLAKRAADGLVMCYPFAEYYDDAMNQTDDPSSVMSYGPRLQDVYTNLGDMAGQILTNSAATLSITQAPSSFLGLQ